MIKTTEAIEATKASKTAETKIEAQDSRHSLMVHVIIVAAGSGSRFGSDLPKQFCKLGDRPVLAHTIANIGRSLPNAHIVLVLSQWGKEYWEEYCKRESMAMPDIVIGGTTRWESVKRAIDVIDACDDDVIMVHDGARPVVKPDMMQRISQAIANGAGAAIPVVPVTDSLRRLDAGGVSHAVDRSSLVSVQTPQAFMARLLIDAYKLPYMTSFTDDASVYEYAGNQAPALVAGDPTNIKITNPRDLEIAQIYIR